MVQLGAGSLDALWRPVSSASRPIGSRGIHNADSQAFISASVWEMQIKLQPRKLKLGLPLPELVKGQQQTNKIRVLEDPVFTKYPVEVVW